MGRWVGAPEDSPAFEQGEEDRVSAVTVRPELGEPRVIGSGAAQGGDLDDAERTARLQSDLAPLEIVPGSEGVFALVDIPKGTRLIEYIGKRIPEALADKLYEDEDDKPSHTFLFSLDDGTVIVWKVP